MLGLWELQIVAAATLVASAGTIVVGLARRPRLARPPAVVARRPPRRGTEVVWVVGTVVALLWPVGAFVAPVVAYRWPAPPGFPYSDAVQLLGALLVLGGAVLFSRSARALGVHMTPAIQAQQGHQLVQEGPYATIRHPIYTAIVAIASGQALLFLSAPAALLALVLAGLAAYRARLEEELLRSPEVFGAAYEAYAARTGRFLPPWRSKP